MMETAFPISIPLIYFSFLNALARTFRTVLNNSDGHACYIARFNSNSSKFSTLRMVFTVSAPLKSLLSIFLSFSY